MRNVKAFSRDTNSSKTVVAQVNAIAPSTSFFAVREPSWREQCAQYAPDQKGSYKDELISRQQRIICPSENDQRDQT